MRVRLLVASVLTPLTVAALAGPADYVFVPGVEHGEREIDFKYGAAGTTDEPTAQGTSLGFGYGATGTWFTEFYVKGAREGAQWKLDAIEFENKFQLTEDGKYPVDLGFITELELPRDRSEGNELRFGPLLQAKRGRWQLNFNLLLTSVSHAVENNGTYLDYQWQVRYHGRRTLAFGAQGFGELGQWTHLAPANEQSHRLGPALFGEHDVGAHEAIVWDAGLLFGVTRASPDWTFRAHAEYEF